MEKSYTNNKFKDKYASINNDLKISSEENGSTPSIFCIVSLKDKPRNELKTDPRHEIYNNVVCATNKGPDQPAHTRSLPRVFASRLDILLTEHYLEFVTLKGGCRGSSEITLVKMPHFWKSHVAAQVRMWWMSG